MQEFILSRMMRISRGTYYSGSWSSTAFILQISLHPCLGLNPSSPGAGRPAHQPRAPEITVLLAWLGLYIDFSHKLTINPLSLYKRQKELKQGGRGGARNQKGGSNKNPSFYNAGKIKPSLPCYTKTIYLDIYLNKFKLHHLYMYLYLCVRINLHNIIKINNCFAKQHFQANRINLEVKNQLEKSPLMSAQSLIKVYF